MGEAVVQKAEVCGQREVFAEKRNLGKKICRSQREIQNSMIRLMRACSYDTITVTMIASDAGINRKTFYDHYRNKDELLFTMVYDMFDDLFGCFMYRKNASCRFSKESQVRRDACNFLEKVTFYEERLLTLITTETSESVILIADQVVLNHCRDIHIFNDGEDKFLQKFYLEVIRNFFMGIIDAWMESQRISLDDGVAILSRLMRQSYLDIFCYGKSG